MKWIVTERQRLHSLFKAYFAPEVTAAILPLTRPALRLGGEGTAARLGGPPLLPVGTAWPMWEGRALDFLALVDFGELAACARLPELPGEGRAAFYYASGTPRPWGDDPGQRGGWRVFTGDLVEVDPPAGAPPGPACALGPRPFLSLPAPQEPELQRIERTYDGTLLVYEQLYAAWLQHLWPNEPIHQVGGWPVLVQDSLTQAVPQLADPDWHPILQLDSDDRLDWHWGDPGRVFFSATPSDLTDAWLTLQAR
jgi:uncharacterized protein DUF1963